MHGRNIRQTNTWGIKSTTETSATMQINSAVFVWSSKTLFIAVVIVSAEHELSYTVVTILHTAQQRKTGSASVERSGTSVEVERKHWDSIYSHNKDRQATITIY